VPSFNIGEPPYARYVAALGSGDVVDHGTSQWLVSAPSQTTNSTHITSAAARFKMARRTL